MSDTTHSVHKPSRLDAIAGFMSLLCAFHCLLLPVALPLLAPFLGNPWFEAGMMLSALILGIAALRHGWKVHGFRLPTILFSLGFTSLLIGNWVLTAGNPLATHSHALFVEPLQSSFVILGAVLLVTAHTINLILERRALNTGNCC